MLPDPDTRGHAHLRVRDADHVDVVVVELDFDLDFVVAAQSTSFIQAFSKIGLVPDCGGTWLLPRLVGRARALGLAMTGDKLPAEEAERMGLIWKGVDDAALMDTTLALANKLALMPAKALAEIVRCTAPLLATAGEIGGTSVPGLDGPEDPQRALIMRSELEVKAGKFDDAMATLRTALQLVSPTSPMATALRGQLGHAYMRRGLSHLATVGAVGSAALADLQEGHKLQGSPATAQALALGLLGTGKAAEALQLLTPIVDTNPNDPRLLGAYGRALRETGQLVESRQTLQKAEGLVTAAGAAPAGANVGLRMALQQPARVVGFVACDSPLGVDHPLIIDALERRLGTQLIHRSTRRLALTEQGAGFLDECRTLLAQWSAAEATVYEG